MVRNTRGTHLNAIDELGKRDVFLVVERVEEAEVIVNSTIPELEAQEITLVREFSAPELDSNGRGIVGDGLETLILFDSVNLMEEGDEGLIRGGLDEELERVAVEGDTLQGAYNGTHESAAGDWKKDVHQSLAIIYATGAQDTKH